MKTRYLVLALIGAMLLSLGAVACGGDDGDDGGNGGGGLTLAEYFDELAVLGQAFADDGDTLDEQAEANFNATESEEGQIEVFITFIEKTATLVDDFVGDIDDLSAPAEVEDLHNEAVTAGQALNDMYGNALTVVETAETFEDATLVFEGPGFVDAADRFGAACIALQDFADSNGLDVGIVCPSEA